MTRDQDNNAKQTSVINYNRKPSTTTTKRPRSSGNGALGPGNSGNNLGVEENLALDDLGASALPVLAKKPGISHNCGQNNNRKKLQLQFSFQERSDEEDNDDESVFFDNPQNQGTSLISDDDEELTTSPSLTFGVVESSNRGGRGHYSKADYRALHRRNDPESADHQPAENSEIIGGAKKKSYKDPSHRSGKRRKASPLSASSSAVNRLENGEIRPKNSEEIEDNRRKNSENSRHRNSDNHNNVNNGTNPIPAGCVGGPSKSTMDKDELNHIIPESKKFPQIAAAVSVSTGCISYGICIAYTSPALPSILELNHTTSLTNILGDEETSWMSSLLALGALFGSLSAVYLMDAVGRKASLLAFSVMSLFIGWTLLMAASQVWQLYTGRFLLGLGAGMEITICPVYIHEICRPALRDVCGSFPQVFIALGILLCYIMGRSLEWNWLALAACLFLFPFVFGLYFIPESPPWLIYNDEEDLAYKSMLMIRGEEYDASVEICRIKDNLARHKNDLHAMLLESVDYMNTDSELGNSILANSANLTENPSNGSRKSSSAISNRSQYKRFGFTDVFQKSVLYPFLVILVLMFLLQFSGQGAVTFYTASIFEKAESSVDPNDCALVIGVTYFLSSILGLVLKKHVGRRVLLLASELGMAVSQLAMGIYFYVLTGTSTDQLKTKYSGLRMLPLPILIIYTLAFNVGMGSLTWVVATEILPVRSRRWTHTVANVTSNLCWFVVTKSYGDISTTFGLFVPFFLYGAVCLFGFLFIYVFLPETRGKTPEETAKAFRGWGPLMKRTGCRSVCVSDELNSDDSFIASSPEHAENKMNNDIKMTQMNN